MEELEPILKTSELLDLQRLVSKIHVAQAVEEYVVRIVHATRSHPRVELGASPRAMISLFRSAQALSALRGRSYVLPDDVKTLVPYVLAHRIIPKAQSHLRGFTAQNIVQEVLNSVPVPVEEEVEVSEVTGV